MWKGASSCDLSGPEGLQCVFPYESGLCLVREKVFGHGLQLLPVGGCRQGTQVVRVHHAQKRFRQAKESKKEHLEARTS